METAELVIIIVLCVLFFGVIAPLGVMSYILFSVLLVRNKPDKWDRRCSAPGDPVSEKMFAQGLEWRDENRSNMREVSVRSGRLRLAGEYYDFGCDRAVIIIAGRMETLIHSCFFAEPYKKAGYNVLVTDPRAHGLSEGRVNTAGFSEYRDILEWGKLLNRNFGIEHIFLHGICIGSQTALFTLTSKNCPGYFEGMCGEGMFVNFGEAFASRMRLKKKPVFPLMHCVMGWIFLFSGGNALYDGPLHRIEKLDRPILFLHSREDIFSLPEKSSAIYEKCRAPHKTVWFEHGEHSRIRALDAENYDRAISDFLSDFFKA